MPGFRKSSLISISLAAWAADAADVYDYVIVGAGSGGCPLASKLAQAGHSVLLMEAGPDSNATAPDTDGNEVRPLDPGNELAFQYAPKIDDAVLSEPIWDVPRPTCDRDARFCALPGVDCANDKLLPYREFMPRAKIVGGCSMHNYLTYIRPSPDFMEKWGPGWEWNTVLPKLIAMESCLEQNVDQRFHGHDGPAFVSNSELQESDRIVIDLVTKAGLPRNDDINGETRVGIGPLPKLVKDKRRWSAAQAWLTPEVRALPNFNLEIEAFATKIEFNDDKKATSVTYTKNGQTKVATARKEIILAAGAFRTPQLLMLSGIGPKQLFQTWPELTPVAELEGVGRNLQDHVQSRMTVPVKEPSIAPLKSGAVAAAEGDMGLTFPNISSLAKYLPDGYDGVSFGGFYFSNWCKANGCTSPDMQYMCGTFPDFVTPVIPGLPNYTAVAVCITIINGDIQTAPGFMTLKSLNASEYPRIYPNYIKSEVDIQRLAEGAKFYVEDVLGQRPDLFDTSIFPLVKQAYKAKPLPIDAYRSFIRDTATTIYHPAGTAKMGRDDDPEAVTDFQGRVYGVTGLRVADASLMPVIANVNTDVPTRLIGYHIADMILGENPSPRIQ